MSAYLCSATHIAIVALAIAARTTDYSDAKQIAAELARENRRSIDYRYPRDAAKHTPTERAEMDADFVAECQLEVGLLAVKFAAVPKPRLIGLAHCLAYQSCECNDWPDTAACKMLAVLTQHPYNSSYGWCWHENEFEFHCRWQAQAA
jgi:hypothetical protein